VAAQAHLLHQHLPGKGLLAEGPDLLIVLCARVLEGGGGRGVGGGGGPAPPPPAWRGGGGRQASAVKAQLRQPGSPPGGPPPTLSLKPRKLTVLPSPRRTPSWQPLGSFVQ
jgi:hypothetical protein